MNLLLLASKNSSHLKYLGYIWEEHILYTLDDEDELYPDEIQWLVVRPWTHLQQEVLEQYPNIDTIFVTWVGTNHIDKQYCQSHNIQIINRPWSNARAVADLAIWGMLTHCRNTQWAADDTVTWVLQPRSTYRGRSLCELSYGFVWCGMISLTIRETLQWFWVTQWTYSDPYLSWDQYWIQESSLELVAASDCLVIWAPHTAQTHEMIDLKVLQHLPPHAIVINIARWGLINESDLIEFLKTRTDCRYYADVWQWDPTITENLQKLTSLPNCILTPHIAAETHEAQTTMHYFEQLA